MAAYFRNFFGGQNPNPTRSSSKDHKRSPSTPSVSTNSNPGYIYAAPGTTSSPSATQKGRERSSSLASYGPNTPSPLRYAYDSGSVRSHASHQHQSQSTSTPAIEQHQKKPARVHIYRSSATKPGDRPAPYPIYSHSHSASFSSAHSASTSSFHHGSSVSGHRPTPSRTPSSGSVTHSEPRPVLKQNSTWSGNSKGAPQAHVSFMNPKRPTTLHMHPLFAYGRLHRPPISYDVTYTPSSRTVVDRSTHTAVPAHTLSQPATEPPTFTKLVLKSDKFPWPIIALPTGTKSGSRFYLAGSSSSKQSPPPVTNLDVLYALHNALSTRVTHQEWEALGHGSRAQRKATQAYERRCLKMGGGWDGGVRRIDYLGEKTRLVGIEVDKTTEGGAGKLVFGKA